MRMKTAVALTMVVLFMSAAVAPVWAHHAFAAEFDANKPVKFEATVTRMEWTNPHVWIHVDVKAPNGTVEKWAFEAGTPNVLFRRGFTKNSLLPGTKIVLDGYRAKDGSRRANGRDVTFPDGKKLFLGSSGTGAPYELTNSKTDRP
jgi:hypothetical protein